VRKALFHSRNEILRLRYASAQNDNLSSSL
jgi:hypothetical protein